MLLNQSCIMHYGREGDISRFILKDDTVYHTIWSRDSGIRKNEIFAEGTEDIKASCDEQGNLYIFCVNISGDIYIFTMSGTKQLKSEIKTGGKEILLRDIRPYIIGEKCMLLISHSKKDNRNERLLTKFTIDTKSLKEGMKYPDYSTKDLMEYETFGPVDEIGAVSIWAEESCIISVIEKNEDSNSIILLKDNRHGYVEGLIKISMETDIYWHDIFVRDNYIRVVYTVRDKDRFTIKTVKYNIKDHMISKETTVRERMACSHPLFVEYMGELWICWYENGAVYSCVIDENGSIEKPLKRKDSAGKKLMYTHFLTDSISLKKRFDFNAGKVFVTYPENRMTGFGRPKF